MSKSNVGPITPPKPATAPAKISRRAFGRRAAAAAASSLAPAALVGRVSEVEEKLPAGRTNNSVSRAGGTGDRASDTAQDVDAKLANIIRKYGDRLSEDQRAHLRRILVYNQKMMGSIRAFPLQNGDPPASVLKISFAQKAPEALKRTAPLRNKNGGSGRGDATVKVR